MHWSSSSACAHKSNQQPRRHRAHRVHKLAPPKKKSGNHSERCEITRASLEIGCTPRWCSVRASPVGREATRRAITPSPILPAGTLHEQEDAEGTIANPANPVNPEFSESAPLQKFFGRRDTLYRRTQTRPASSPWTAKLAWSTRQASHTSLDVPQETTPGLAGCGNPFYVVCTIAPGDARYIYRKRLESPKAPVQPSGPPRRKFRTHQRIPFLRNCFQLRPGRL